MKPPRYYAVIYSAGVGFVSIIEVILDKVIVFLFNSILEFITKPILTEITLAFLREYINKEVSDCKKWNFFAGKCI